MNDKFNFEDDSIETRLEEMLLEGLHSGECQKWTEEVLEELRSEIKTKAARKAKNQER